jgi:hypothetical protein
VLLPSHRIHRLTEVLGNMTLVVHDGAYVLGYGRPLDLTRTSRFCVRIAAHIPFTQFPASVAYLLRCSGLRTSGNGWFHYFFRIKTMNTTITRTHVPETDRMDTVDQLFGVKYVLKFEPTAFQIRGEVGRELRLWLRVFARPNEGRLVKNLDDPV